MKRTKQDDDLIRRFLNEETEEEEKTAAEQAAEDAGEDVEEPEEEAEEADTENEEVKSSVVDTELEAVLIDFETEARKQKTDETQSESKFYKKGIKYLLEQEGDYEEKIDIPVFSSELARLIKNYDNLLDMESIIMKKATDFIEKKYGQEAVEAMKDELTAKHDLDLESKSSGLESQSDVPNAVGAASGAAVGE